MAGDGFMTFVVAALILFVFALCFYADWLYVNNRGACCFGRHGYLPVKAVPIVTNMIEWVREKSFQNFLPS